ncbi:MAG: UbiA family prenyltransferase [Thermoplasmata archaeon]
MAKLTIREGYDRVEFVPRKLRGYIDLVRPFTLLAPAVGGTAAALIGLSVSTGGALSRAVLIDHATELLWGVSALVLVNAASNALNAAYDAEIDKINKPYRPVPSGVVTEDEARSIAWILYLVTIWRAATAFRLTFSFLVLLIMLITITYSMPPLRLKKRLWVSNIVIALTRGTLGFVAAWSIFDDPLLSHGPLPFDPAPFVIGGIMSVFLTGATTTKDFTDIEGDRRFGVRTLPVVYGPRRAALLSSPFLVLPFALIPIATYLDVLRMQANYLVLLLPWAVYLIHLLREARFEQDPHLENSPVWKHMYLMLLAMQLGFMAVFVLPLPWPFS